MSIPGGYTALDVLTASDMNLLPAGLEGGGFASATSNQGGITTITDLTSLSVTFTAVTGRRYWVMVETSVVSTVATDLAALTIADGSNNVLQQRNHYLPSAGVTSTYCSASVVISPTAGSFTVKARLARQSGTGTLQSSASATTPATLTVIDIGPT